MNKEESQEDEIDLIVLINGFLGFVLSCGFVLVKDPLKNILKEISA